MNKTNNNRKQNSPPNLLKGILTAVLSITIGTLALSWYIIDFQLEQLVIKRTSEYAHSIARIAADYSAEALLSDDKLQLNLLVENVAKDQYIRQATIISEDGQMVTQYPEEIISRIPSLAEDSMTIIESKKNARQEGLSTDAKSKAKTPPKFLARQRNKIFFEQISYQDITAGWFKLEIDKYLLEQNFREIFINIQLIIASISLLLLSLLIFIVYRFDQSIKSLTGYCQRLLVQAGIKPSKGKRSWLNAVKELSQSPQQRLQEHINLPQKTNDWISHQISDATLICYLEFDINHQENSQTADNLTRAEIFLNKSVQAFGVQSQGDILSGCLIPVENNIRTSDTDNNRSLLVKAISLISLIRRLLSLLSPEIRIKAFIMKAPVLFLEDEQEITTGVTLLAHSFDKIKQLSLQIKYNEIVSLSISPTEFKKIAGLSPLEPNNKKDDTQHHSGIKHPFNETKDCFKIDQVDPIIKQQIARKFKYISEK